MPKIKAAPTRKQSATATTPLRPAKGRTGSLPQPEAIKTKTPELRWQRTQRYVWDKGGSKGGRR